MILAGQRRSKGTNAGVPLAPLLPVPNHLPAAVAVRPADAGDIMAQAWIVNFASVAAEQFDTEMVIINFDTGRYFSMGGSAAWAWEALKNGASVAALGRNLALTAREDLATFIERLSREKLIVPADAPVADTVPPPPAWSTPTLEGFDDLAELIAVDPVHEVDELLGWPKRPAR